jgi:hypothetical protein
MNASKTGSRHSRRVVRFVHDRCNEYDSTEYLFAPDGWSDEEIDEAVRAVRDEMISDAQAISSSPLKPPWHAPYKEHPDKTVAEVDALHAKQHKAYDVWKKENERLTRSFSDRLRERGFLGLWEDESPAYESCVFWGHHHGLDLNYGPPKRDDFGI